MTRAWLVVAIVVAAQAPLRASAQPFRYPLTCGSGCLNYMISYFDESPGGGISDWACGRSTYNGHRGTDWPVSYGRAIVAGATGTVIASRSDCFDRCTRALLSSSGRCSDSCTNLVVLRHDSGAATQYLHMQTGSVTVGYGARVACGTHIGNVASSGYSTGNHLHFGYWPPGAPLAGAARNDPFAGPCSPWSSVFLDQGGHGGVPSDRCYVDDDGDGSPADQDCDDHDASRRPGRAEDCDGRENDCDAAIDEDVHRTCGTDVGECVAGVETCTLGTWGVCVGEVPPRVELCDLLDDDCDGVVDGDRACEHADAALAAVLSPAHSDVDGDGLVDACMRTPEGFECLLGDAEGFDRRVRGPRMLGGSWDEPASYGSIRMSDVDGDGLDDVCMRADERVVCFRANGDGFGESAIDLSVAELGLPTRSAQLWLADVDGDHHADPCVRGTEGLRCLPSGTGAGTGTALFLRALSDAEGWDDVARYGSIRFGDVNGDGRDDVCARAASGLRCWLGDDASSFGEQWVGPAWTDAAGWSEPRFGSTLRIADVDGDGTDDVCGRGPDGFVCALGGREGFARDLRTGPPMRGEAWDERAAYATVRMADVDGDGTSDLCARIDERLRCWLWDGDAHRTVVVGPRLVEDEGWDDPLIYESLRLADVDGDLRADACARDAEGIVCWTSTADGFGETRRVRAWSDADGAGDARYTSSFMVAGQTTPAPTPSCACAAGRGRSTTGAWLVASLAVIVVRRRLRRG